MNFKRTSLKYRDGRRYVHGSDIFQCAMELFPGLENQRTIVDLHRPTSTPFKFVAPSDVSDSKNSPLFSVKTFQAQKCQEWIAVPVSEAIEIENVQSSCKLSAEVHSSTGFEALSGAEQIADLIHDLVLAIKSHRQQHAYRDPLMIRRIEADHRFFATGGWIQGTWKDLKMGAERWTFVRPECPDALLTMTGLPMRGHRGEPLA